MATTEDKNPMRLRVELACGCALTFGRPRPDARILLEDHEHGARCPSHARFVARKEDLLGIGPWWTWDANEVNRAATTADRLWTWEPEHLYVAREQYLFLEGVAEAFGPIARVTWLNHIPVLR